MTQSEFVRLCVLCGYASIKDAEAYAAGRSELTEIDFEHIYHAREYKLQRARADQERFRQIIGVKTTKKFDY